MDSILHSSQGSAQIDKSWLLVAGYWFHVKKNSVSKKFFQQPVTRNQQHNNFTSIYTQGNVM